MDDVDTAEIHDHEHEHGSPDLQEEETQQEMTSPGGESYAYQDAPN